MEIVARVVPTTAAVASDDEDTLKMQDPIFVMSSCDRTL
jgi:hypothetical protein